jgi:diguanylate cyclase (GGDEF)-like protein
MNYTGRLATILLTTTFHTAYIFYYFKRDGVIDPLDLLGYPIFFLLSYWGGLQYDRAIYYSEKDTLTNLYNRRYVISIFDKFFAQAKRSNSAIYALLLDCDRFKEINDSYNHHMGDEVLRRISKILMDCTRKGDIVSRWGGDEFLILGQYNRPSDMESSVQGIQSELIHLSNEMGLCISASIGSAVYSEEQHHDLSDLIREADKHMYDMKMEKKPLRRI